MAHASRSPEACPVPRALQHYRQAPGLPFADLLTADRVRQALRDEHVAFRQRLFSPLVTLWVFLSQVLDPDHSCRAAVARFLAWRTARGLPPCSADTGSYCRARARLPEGVLARLTRTTGWQLHDDAPPRWRWCGRPVQVVDGTTLSMPDTPANRADYPLNPAQEPGLGFPLARLVVLFSLTVGTVLDAVVGPCRGKGTGEASLFHALHRHLAGGAVVLGDRGFGSFWELALVQRWGADLVSRLHHCRRADFRTGHRLGRDDHVVCWAKPSRPAWLDRTSYDALPALLAVRELRVRVPQPGFRTRTLVVVTTLLDPVQFPRAELAVLYRWRWQAELDLRSLKQALQMDVLRGQSAALVRKEIWAHLLAYNLVRGLMARVAQQTGQSPVQLSFKGALQTVNAFAALLWLASGVQQTELCRELRAAVARHRVGQRPDRVEPRRRKRRPKPYPLLTEPRDHARARLLAGS
jgi:Transposase DDE domain